MTEKWTDTSEPHQAWIDVNTNMRINPYQYGGRAVVGCRLCRFTPGVQWVAGSVRAAVLPFCSHHLPVIAIPVGIFCPPKCPYVYVRAVSLSHHSELSGAWCFVPVCRVIRACLCKLSSHYSLFGAASIVPLRLLSLFISGICHWWFPLWLNEFINDCLRWIRSLNSVSFSLSFFSPPSHSDIASPAQ